MTKRLKKAIEILKNKKVDAVLLSCGYNIRYISGFAGATGYLYISESNQVIITDSRYTLQAKEEFIEGEVVEIDSDGYNKAINNLLREDKVRNLGIEENNLYYSDYLNFKENLINVDLIAVGDEFTNMRRIKTTDEIEKIRKAEAIGDKAFEMILPKIKVGVTEIEIAAELEYLMKMNGATALSFDTIVASGINSSMPHAEVTLKKIEKGDFVTMDFGCKYEGYCSDMTRTVVVGKASTEQKKVYNTVLKAQKAAIAYIRPLISGREIDSIARNIIDESEYKGCFGHGLGHSVGLFIHEGPRLSRGEDELMYSNMLETVEPGIYLKGFYGVRIEDLVVVTKNGCENLTHSPKELMEL